MLKRALHNYSAVLFLTFNNEFVPTIILDPNASRHEILEVYFSAVCGYRALFGPASEDPTPISE